MTVMELELTCSLEDAEQALREKDEQIKALEEALRVANKEHEKTKRKLRERDRELREYGRGSDGFLLDTTLDTTSMD